MSMMINLNKKGFTLVELIGVITLLVAIALVTTPIVNGTLRRSKDRALKEQINSIISITKGYVLEHGMKDKVYLSELVDKKLIEDDKIYNPVTEENFLDTNACVNIMYDETTKSYIYEFMSEC